MNMSCPVSGCNQAATVNQPEHTAVDGSRRAIEQMTIIELQSRFRGAHVEHATRSLARAASRLARGQPICDPG